MKYSVLTFGCRVNQADSLGFEEALRARGAEPSAIEAADLVVVNTCSVTATSDQSARQAIRRIARVNPDARIVVTGCYATRRPEDVAALPNVVRVVANDDKPRVVSLLATDFGLTTAERFGDGDGSCGAAIEPGVAGRTAFTLRVQTGCAEPCSYCIIPATRGVPRSVPIGEVCREVERIVAAGYKEIALTGVHLGSYGRDLNPRTSLIALLARLAGNDIFTARGAPPPLARAAALEDSLSSRGPQAPWRGRQAPVPAPRFRISSLEPMDCSREIVDLVAAGDRIARHFHLPLQHASDRVLAAMRRPYTLERYASLVDDIRARMPDASIGADLIVGFPGETEGDIDALAAYLESSPLTHLHVFPYSDRPGTSASRLGDRAPGQAVRERTRRIRAIGARLAACFRAAQVGTTHRGLTLEDGSLVVTGNYLKVRIPPGRQRNEWVDVEITNAGDPMLGVTANAQPS